MVTQRPLVSKRRRPAGSGGRSRAPARTAVAMEPRQIHIHALRENLFDAPIACLRSECAGLARDLGSRLTAERDQHRQHCRCAGRKRTRQVFAQDHQFGDALRRDCRAIQAPVGLECRHGVEQRTPLVVPERLARIAGLLKVSGSLHLMSSMRMQIVRRVP